MDSVWKAMEEKEMLVNFPETLRLKADRKEKYALTLD